MIFLSDSIPNFYGLLALMYGRTDTHPGPIPNFKSTVFDIGAGYLFPFNSHVALRAEARYRTDQHDRKQAGVGEDNGAFQDALLNVGLNMMFDVPIGRAAQVGGQLVDRYLIAGRRGPQLEAVNANLTGRRRQGQLADPAALVDGFSAAFVGAAGSTMISASESAIASTGARMRRSRPSV